MKIAVLGAGGMLGHKMCQVLEKMGFAIAPVFHKSVDHYKRFQVLNLDRAIGGIDATNEAQLYQTLQMINPDAVVNCIGMTTRKLGQVQPSQIILLNAVLPHRLEEWAEKNNRRLIHFSTDCVFNGDRGPYFESDEPNAIDLYGRSKALGEVRGPKSVTIRSSIVGLELENRTELIEWFLSQKNRPVGGYRHSLYTGVTTNFMASVVGKILQEHPNLSGLHQLASSSISKFELLNIANEVFENGSEIAPVENEPVDKRLDGSKFFSLTGIKTPSWTAMIQEVANENEIYREWRAE